MAIKNKDGSPYKLRGPNPLMNEQNQDGDFVLHNMSWKDIEIPDLEERRDLNKNFKKKNDPKPATKTEFKPEPIPEVSKILEPEPEPEIKPTPEPEPILEPEPEPPPEVKTITNTVDVWCLPAIYEGSRIKYLEKVMFQAVIVSNNGLQLIFWTNIDLAKKGSIIFPFRNSEGGTYGEYSWWKVSQVIGPDKDERLKESGGLLHVCVPSELTPNFAD